MEAKRDSKSVHHPKMSPTLRRLKLYLYYPCLVFLVGLTATQSGQVIHKYLEDLTYISSRYQSQGSSVLPSVSICPDIDDLGNPSLKQSVLSEFGITDYSSLNWTKSFGAIGPDDIMDKATYELWELVDSLEIQSIDEDPYSNEKFFTVSPASENSKNLIIDRIHPKFGRCFTFSPKPKLKSLGINSLKIAKKSNISINLRLFLHVDDLFWDATNRQMGYLLQDLESATTQITYKHLKTIQKVNFIGDKLSCSYNSYDQCVEESFYETLSSKTGCRVPWVRNNLSVCTTSKLFDAARAIVRESIDATNNICLSPCDFIMVTVGTSNYDIGTQSTDMTLFMPYRVMESTENYLNSFLSMAAEIGGYVGLLLGVSFIDLVNFLKLRWTQRKEGVTDNKAAEIANLARHYNGKQAAIPIVFTH